MIFVERPRLAAVGAIALSLAGLVALYSLPVAQYPDVAPPRIVVSCTYPGASAEEVLRTVAMPLEEGLNGVEGMLFMSGGSNDSGGYSCGITFEVGTDRDVALMKVQNRVQQQLSKLPVEVRNTGLSVRCASEDQLGFVCLRSPGGALSRFEISDYAYQAVQPALLRVSGVGDATVRGPQAAVRVWLDPQRLAACGLGTEEVVAAIRRQNVQASIGKVGASPTGNPDLLSLTLVSRGRLARPEEFGRIVVRTDAQGGQLFLSDVARTEIAQREYAYDSACDGVPAVAIDLSQLPGANAIDTVRRIRAAMADLAKRFPAGLEWSMPYDTTEYVGACLREIVETLLLTALLVALVCWLFLQDVRATLVPLVTIPVSLLATFTVLAAFGYSVNVLTLFALVLAIGLVVDDAIVVVERVQHLMASEGLSARDAANRAMRDVAGAVVSTTLVLLGIFVPVGFLGGVAGVVYRQFAVTLSAAVVFSAASALSLAPALCAVLLKGRPPAARGPFAWFNALLSRVRGTYLLVALALARRGAVLVLLLTLAALASASFARRIPKAFIPDEDLGVVKCDLNTPEGTTLPVTMRVCDEVSAEVRKIPGVRSVLSIAGDSYVGGVGENQAMMVVTLDSWSKRTDPGRSAEAIRDRIAEIAARTPLAVVRTFLPSSVPGLSSLGGVKVNVESRADIDTRRLDREVTRIARELEKSPKIREVAYGAIAQTPHLRLVVDREKCELLRVPLDTVYATLQHFLGSLYVNDVNLGVTVNRVTVQADWEGRQSAERALDLFVRSEAGAMVPLSALATFRDELGPCNAYRFNQYLFSAPNVRLAPGVSSGEGMAEVARILEAQLPRDYAYEWNGMSFHESRSRGNALFVFPLAVLFGYLFLVALYESWRTPLPVMLSAVFAVFGSLAVLLSCGFSLSIYAQLGLVLLVGLAAKNAILVVQFAKSAQERDGLSAEAAAAEGIRERFRAVLMTSSTFVLGLLPMAFASGAGAVGRREIGVTVLAGMVSATLVGLACVPGLFVLFRRGGQFRRRERLVAAGGNMASAMQI